MTTEDTTRSASVEIEQALKPLATYDHGSSRGALAPIEVLANRGSADEKLRARLEEALLGLLDRKPPVPAVAFICSQLVKIGSDASVPALARLLEAPSTFEAARAALAAVPTRRARSVLLEQLMKFDGPRQVGVVQTLGTCGETRAVRPLTRLARSSNPEVALAAAEALGEIGTSRCAQVLAALFEKAAPVSRKALANALLVCAEKRAAAKDQKTTRLLCDRLFNGGLPPYMRVAASQISESVSS